MVWEKSPYGALVCTIRIFLQTKNKAPLGLFSFLGPRLQSQFLGWKNAFTPHLIDSDGRTIHKGSEYGPNSKIMKNTKRTFLQTTADFLFLGKFQYSNFLGISYFSIQYPSFLFLWKFKTQFFFKKSKQTTTFLMSYHVSQR